MTESIGQDAAQKLYQTRWWKGKSWEEILLKQAQCREVICPLPLYLVAWSNVMGRWPGEDELQHGPSVRKAIRVAKKRHKGSSKQRPARKAKRKKPTRCKGPESAPDELKEMLALGLSMEAIAHFLDVSLLALSRWKKASSPSSQSATRLKELAILIRVWQGQGMAISDLQDAIMSDKIDVLGNAVVSRMEGEHHTSLPIFVNLGANQT